MGEERFNRLLQQRAPEKLQDGKQMLYEHALRCFCKLCGSLLNWDCPEDISYTETECCGLLYRLKPWTVHVLIEDVSSRPILPKMPGSNYSDPECDLSGQLVGDLKTIETTSTRPLSASQKALRGPPKESSPEPEILIHSKPLPSLTRPSNGVEVKKNGGVPQKSVAKPERRCSVCREPGHDKRRCPKVSVP